VTPRTAVTWAGVSNEQPSLPGSAADKELPIGVAIRDPTIAAIIVLGRTSSSFEPESDRQYLMALNQPREMEPDRHGG
jgi:hypothetical protein